MRKKYLFTLVILAMIFALTSGAALAEVGLGGKVETKVISNINNRGKVDNYLQNHLNLKFFLPKNEFVSAKIEVDINSDESLIDENKKVNASFKKLYLRHRLDDFDLTIGRQPISWSFGSLINPVDFNLGAEAMGEETLNKNVDAVEFYLPIDWTSSLAAIASFPGNGETKYGIRSRTNFKGYDLSLNYVQGGKLSKRRVGITGKGNIGLIGVYGAGGYYFADNTFQGEVVYLLGVDYSFNINYVNKLLFQLEYLYDETGALITSLPIPNLIEQGKLDLVSGLVSYELDDFSKLKLMGITSLGDKSFILMPQYQRRLRGNLDFKLSSSLFIGDKGEIFAPQKLGSKGVVEVELSYPF
ncbi:MAG: hypothetical protein AWU54_2009 [Candidatus Frackibacter sp. T328-2]|nr:MAG: hypothetical protein AWU54_2009 [Candidatus Frackibacter sp. T328-2]